MFMKLSDCQHLPKEEYDALYWKLREKNDRSVFGQLSLSTRQKMHLIFLAAYRVINRINGIRVIVSGESIPSEGPFIFAATHVGKYDVEAIGEAIRSHFYLLSGDFENLQGGMEQIFLNLNGVFYFRETDAADRKSVVQKMIQHLCDGGNMLYYPEGAWNFSPNLPVQPLFPGIIRVAKEGNARIVPIGAEQYGKRFVIRVGDPMNPNDYPDIDSALEALRDQMATLKWFIWDAEPCAQRRELHTLRKRLVRPQVLRGRVLRQHVLHEYRAGMVYGGASARILRRPDAEQRSLRPGADRGSAQSDCQ